MSTAKFIAPIRREPERETVKDATQSVQLATTQALAHIGARNTTGANARHG
jgi:hypothetical protein